MSTALKVAHEDAEAMWVARIREHLMSAEPGLAQEVLAEAVAAGVTGPDIERLQKLLGPPRVRVSPIKDVNRSAEFNWLRQHSRAYQGEWVAVLKDELVAHAATLKEVLAELDRRPTPESPLLHFIQPRPAE